MSFQATETSVETAAPIELYQLILGTQEYYMTSSDQPVVALGQTFIPTEISRNQIQISPDEKSDVVEITLPSDHDYPARYVNIVPGQRGTLTIFRVHSTDGAGETQMIFKGVVRSVAFDSSGYSAKLAVMPLTAALSRVLPRFMYQGLCNNVLYDANCKLAEADFRHRDLCLAVSSDGLTLTIQNLSTKGSGWATGGFISVGSTDFRLILSHTGNNITLLIPFPGSVTLVNQQVDVFAGCDHSLPTCKTKFNNVTNYGGFGFVPKINIFSSGLQ